MEDEKTSPAYLKGFNQGYILAKHEPELLDKLLKSGNDDKEFIRAMHAGSRQHQKERLIEQMKQTQQKDKSKNKGRDI